MSEVLQFRPPDVLNRDERPHILVTHSRDGIGGSVKIGARLARELAQRGWDITAACNSAGPVLDYHRQLGLRATPIFDAAGFSYRSNPSDGNAIRRAHKRTLLFRAARRYLRRNKPALIHAHDDSSALAWAFAAAPYRIPLVWHVHQQLAQGFADPLLRRRAAHVVLVSHANGARFEGKRSPPISVIYNGVDTTTFHPDGGRLANTRPVIGFVSNLVERKRPNWVLRAVAQLVHDGVDAEALFAGADFSGGRKAAQLDECALAEGVHDHYRYVGFQPDVAALLRSIDILALPSQRDKEAFPLIVLEAMACGVPVVATAVAGIPEAVIPGHTGELVDPDDFEGFVGALKKLALRRDLRRAYGAAAVEMCSRRFSLQAGADQLEDVYRQVLEAHRAVA
jgi:glycosyltransferase involved in cell wall biosynthesis